jgi:cell division protein FtsL
VIAAAKVFMVALAVMAIVACVRIGMAAATVNTMIESQTISSQTDSLRSNSSNLEVKESTLSNPSYVKNVASTQLGMAAASETDTLVLGEDVVSVDDSGNLSLSQSLAVAAQG